MTCERSEFVTNAYKYTAGVANFERMSNLVIRKHIRKNIRLCVRAIIVNGVVTNAYKYSASVANFERMAKSFIRKHIR